MFCTAPAQAQGGAVVQRSLGVRPTPTAPLLCNGGNTLALCACGRGQTHYAGTGATGVTRDHALTQPGTRSPFRFHKRTKKVKERRFNATPLLVHCDFVLPLLAYYGLTLPLLVYCDLALPLAGILQSNAATAGVLRH